MDYRLEQLRYALREDPTSRQFFQLGELLRRTNRLDEAVQVLRNGLSHHPKYVAAYIALGRTLISKGDHAEAEETLASALQLDPENAVAARLIGQSAMQRRDPLRAIQALKLARALGDSAPTLEEEIAAVEAELAERGLLQGTMASDVMPPAPSEAGQESGSELVLDMEPLTAETDEDLAIDEEQGQRADIGTGVHEAAAVEDGEPFAEPELEEAASLPADRDEPFADEPFPASEPMPEPAEPQAGARGDEWSFDDTSAEEQELRGPAQRREDVGVAEQAGTEPHVSWSDAPRALEVSDEEPFGIEPGSDTGVWALGADVFATDEGRDEAWEDVEGSGAELEHAPDEVTVEPERAHGIWLDEPEPEEAERAGVEGASSAPIEQPPAPPIAEHEASSDEEHEPAAELEPMPSDVPAGSSSPEPGAQWQLGDEADRASSWENPPGYDIPPGWEAPPEAGAIATPTMVRLALGQGDVDLAASTLAALAADQPEHPDLGELETALAQARRASIVTDSAATTHGHDAAGAEPADSDLVGTDQVVAPSAPAAPMEARKIAALRSWLNAVRLASGTVEL